MNTDAHPIRFILPLMYASRNTDGPTSTILEMQFNTHSDQSRWATHGWNAKGYTFCLNNVTSSEVYCTVPLPSAVTVILAMVCASKNIYESEI